MQPVQTFYALLGESQHLSFIICTSQEDIIEGYGALLEQLYQMKRDAVQEECAYFILAGSRQEITEIITKCNGIKENRLERVTYIRNQINEIFEGRTQAPFVYIDGYPEDIDRHFALMKRLMPNHGKGSAVTEI
jgi:hypothetical protein